jgi:hypothetical protein
MSALALESCTQYLENVYILEHKDDFLREKGDRERKRERKEMKRENRGREREEEREYKIKGKNKLFDST